MEITSFSLFSMSGVSLGYFMRVPSTAVEEEID